MTNASATNDLSKRTRTTTKTTVSMISRALSTWCGGLVVAGRAFSESCGTSERVKNEPTMATTVFRTCTLCEAACGLAFEVDGERILSVRPDPDDVLSHGYVCPKGIAMKDVHDDPDRLRQPLRRTAAGDFAPCSWDEAFNLVVGRLQAIRAAHGPNAVGVYMGNPIVHNHGALLLRTALLQALGTRNSFSAGSG